MPVTSTSVALDWSAKDGASRWIWAVWSLEIGPASSIGSPMTFMMRPRVAGPTGTVMGSPVSTTSCPRVRPSVVSMAMVRTAFSPRCWATSSTRRKLSPVRWSVLVVSMALRMRGRWPPSNSTSTTAPITWVMRPLAPISWPVMERGCMVMRVSLAGRRGGEKAAGGGSSADQSNGHGKVERRPLLVRRDQGFTGGLAQRDAKAVAQ